MNKLFGLHSRLSCGYYMRMDDDLAPWHEPAPPPLQSKQIAPDYEIPEYSPEELKAMGNRLLYRLGADLERNFEAYKPNEALAITKEIKDRTDGRAAQSITVDAKSTVTHEHLIRLDPAEAYRLLVSGGAQVTGMPVIDVTPAPQQEGKKFLTLDPGGDGGNTGAG